MSNWKETADLFSKIITYPELSEKLLKRPPFKYILSIYTSVMQKTNFMKNDFEEKLSIKNGQTLLIHDNQLLLGGEQLDIYSLLNIFFL